MESDADQPGACPRTTTDWYHGKRTSIIEERNRRATGFLPVNVRVMRSSQLDALQLDEELILLLKEQLSKSLLFFQQDIWTRYYPELSLLLRTLIFKFSIWSGRPSPGMAMLNLQYSSGVNRHGYGGANSSSNSNNHGLHPWQQSCLYLMDIVVPYLWSKLYKRTLLCEGIGEKHVIGISTRQLHTMESFLSMVRLVNHAVFILKGTYRTLPERILGASMLYSQQHADRTVSFEYLNRQLVWGEISELALFVLPLVNVSSLRRTIERYLPGMKGVEVAKSYQGDPSACPVCGSSISPVSCTALPCGHHFCYYCLSSRLFADLCECARCGERVETLRLNK